MNARAGIDAVFGHRLTARSRPVVALALISAAAILALAAPVAQASPPTLTIDPVTGASITTAHVSGKVEVPADGSETYWCFERTEEGANNWSGFCYQGSVQPGESATPDAYLEGLKAGTKYEVRLAGLSEGVEESSSVETFETEPVVAPGLALDPPSSVEATGAHLSGTVNPEGGNEDAHAGVLPIAWELQLNREGGGWETVGSGELTGAEAQATSAQTISADATGLIPNSTYGTRLVAHYAGLRAETAEEEFTTTAVAPTFTSLPVWGPIIDSAQLNAYVNPHHSTLTDCHFVWGSGGALDHSAPCEAPLAEEAFTLPGGEGDVQVSARISGLAPSTTYSYRLVATNGGGTAEDTASSFQTAEAAGAAGCPNESVRLAQHATDLPDCRAYEKVSPADKNNGDIIADGLNVIAAADGNAVAFNAHTGFAGAVSSGVSGNFNYLARRSASGWTTRGITPASQPEANQTINAATKVQQFSTDLRTAVVFGYDLPTATGDVPSLNNIYAEDTETGSLSTVTAYQTASPPPTPTPAHLLSFSTETIWGISDDARHIAFVSNLQFLPEIPSQTNPGENEYPNGLFTNNIYQWNDGSLSLAGILPDGTVPPEGSTAGFEVSRGAYRRNMSADGSRLLFRASPTPGAPTQLYQRIDGTRTAWISEPENPAFIGEPENVHLEAATPDGRNVYFTTDSQLLPEDENTGPDIYRWTAGSEPEASGKLTLITHTGGFPYHGTYGGSVVGVSDDGQIAYLQSLSGQLTVWNRGVTRLISADVAKQGFSDRQLTVTADRPGFARVTQDGHELAFLGETATTFRDDERHSLTGQVTNGHTEMYLYSLEDNALTCVSCPQGEASNDTSIAPATGSKFDVTNYQGLSILDTGIRPEFLSEDGRVFFSTPEGLVAKDTNSTRDAYQYDPKSGRLSLLSSGRGSLPSAFLDASAAGSDVFIATRQRLNRTDTDDLVDIYDVRSGGGLPEPEPPTTSCEGEACQGAAAANAAVPRVASGLPGAGNLHQSRHARCHGSKHEVSRHGRSRCVTKKHHRRHHKRHAKHNRRAGK